MFRKVIDKLIDFKDTIADKFMDAGMVGKFAIIIVAGLVSMFWLVFAFQYEINDDIDLKPKKEFVFEGGSQTVAMAATILSHEINDTIWVPNKPLFYPIALGDDMYHYQLGVHFAVTRWAIEMADTIGRERGSGSADKDLLTAIARFNIDPTAYLFPNAPSEYNEGIAHLRSYNQRIAKGQARFERRADNFAIFLDRISKDLGSQANTIELKVLTPDMIGADDLAELTDAEKRILSSNWGHFDLTADDVFYAVKGRTYAYYILLAAMGEDFKDVLTQKGAVGKYNKMLLSLKSAADLYSLSISNGELMSWFTPSHLSQLGFFVMRANKQIDEISDMLIRG